MPSDTVLIRAASFVAPPSILQPVTSSRSRFRRTCQAANTSSAESRYAEHVYERRTPPIDVTPGHRSPCTSLRRSAAHSSTSDVLRSTSSTVAVEPLALSSQSLACTLGYVLPRTMSTATFVDVTLVIDLPITWCRTSLESYSTSTTCQPVTPDTFLVSHRCRFGL